MSETYDLYNEEILPKLKTLTGVSVLDGYLVHYAKDLLNGENGISFPCVAIQPDSENVQGQRVDKCTLLHSAKLIGAVSAVDPKLVNRDIMELIKEVRKSLQIDKYNNDSKAIEITFGNVTYNLPESQDQYAFFELQITFKLMEKWI